jgi:uncharacterized protein YbaR (Trm112 family)
VNDGGVPLPPYALRVLRGGQDLLEILRCPTCRRRLRPRTDALRCRRGHDWPVVHGVPVFSEVGRDVEVREEDHVSHQPGERAWAELAAGPSPWLHLGAGATTSVLPGSVELETAIFPNTAVVGDVHSLPFADQSLRGVLALNVFEHLADPPRAAAELRRVLAPGSRLVIQSAFLQPLHADPSHYFNATEHGMRVWFRDFDQLDVHVPGNMAPCFALGWMASDLLFHADEADREALAALTLGELGSLWQGEACASPGLVALDRVPEHVRRMLAAGFEVRAVRP